MREKLDAWLKAAAATQGVMAAGVRLSARVCLSRSANDRFPMDRLNMACQLAAEITSLLGSQQPPPTRLLWRFREGELHYAVRPDGIAAGLLTKPNVGSVPEFQGLVTVFESLI